MSAVASLAPVDNDREEAGSDSNTCWPVSRWPGRPRRSRGAWTGGFCPGRAGIPTDGC